MNINDLSSLALGGITGAGFGALTAVGTLVLFLIIAWTLVWKGIALWKSARKEHLVWFIVLLLVNTLGILEILYIFIFSNMGRKAKKRR